MLEQTLPAGALVVTALGNASYLWAAMHHTPENFYIEDAMGLALPLALGLAIAQPARRVVVVEGDGAILMHMGTLVTLGAVAPGNLTVLLIQNGVHAASGGQPLTNATLDLAQLARSAGVSRATNVETAEGFAQRVGFRICRSRFAGHCFGYGARSEGGAATDHAGSSADETPLHGSDRSTTLRTHDFWRRTI